MNKKELLVKLNRGQIFRKHVSNYPLTLHEKGMIEEYKKKYIENNERWKWYTSIEVCFEIVKLMRQREINFHNIVEHKQPIRWLWCSSLNWLFYHWFSYSFLEKKLTLHRSLATYKDMPHFPDGAQRGEVIRKAWTHPQKYFEHMTHREAVLDIDAKNFNQAYGWCKKAVKLFDEYNVQYFLQFSGVKGFHLIIPNFPQLKIIKQTTQLNEAFVEDISNYLNIEVDSVPASIPIAYTKISYSIDPRNNRVILPLTKEQFMNFDFDMLKVDNVLKNIEIRDRGLCLHNTGNIDNVKKLIESI